MAKVRICPKCKKARLRIAFNVSGWLAPRMYQCDNCNYLGPLYVEVDPEDFEISEENKTEKNKSE